MVENPGHIKAQELLRIMYDLAGDILKEHGEESESGFLDVLDQHFIYRLENTVVMNDGRRGVCDEYGTVWVDGEDVGYIHRAKNKPYPKEPSST